MRGPVIDFSHNDDGGNIPVSTWEGLTQTGVAKAAIEDLVSRVPEELRRHLDAGDIGPRLSRLAFMSDPYAISEPLAEALGQVNPEMLSRFKDKSNEWRERRGLPPL